MLCPTSRLGKSTNVNPGLFHSSTVTVEELFRWFAGTEWNEQHYIPGKIECSSLGAFAVRFVLYFLFVSCIYVACGFQNSLWKFDMNDNG